MTLTLTFRTNSVDSATIRVDNQTLSFDDIQAPRFFRALYDYTRDREPIVKMYDNLGETETFRLD